MIQQQERVARHIAASPRIKVTGILGIFSLCVELDLINVNEPLTYNFTTAYPNVLANNSPTS